MKMAKSVLVIFGFLHLCVSSAIADGAGLEWKILNQQVNDLYDAGMYGRAVVAREALELAAQQRQRRPSRHRNQSGQSSVDV